MAIGLSVVQHIQYQQEISSAFYLSYPLLHLLIFLCQVSTLKCLSPSLSQYSLIQRRLIGMNADDILLPKPHYAAEYIFIWKTKINNHKKTNISDPAYAAYHDSTSVGLLGYH